MIGSITKPMVLLAALVAALMIAGCSSGSSGGAASSNETAQPDESAGASAVSSTASSASSSASDAASPEKTTAEKTAAEKTRQDSRREADAADKAPEAARGGPATALSGLEIADKTASDWSKDAKIYAIASVVPKVDSGGRSPGWLYTYASSSRGAVLSIAVQGGKPKREQEQQLPDSDLQRIMDHTLPPPDKLKDSSEAMEEAGKVQSYLQENTDAQASAGLDSFSSEDPVWIFATISKDERIEEKVSAAGGS